MPPVCGNGKTTLQAGTLHETVQDQPARVEVVDRFLQMGPCVSECLEVFTELRVEQALQVLAQPPRQGWTGVARTDAEAQGAGLDEGRVVRLEDTQASQIAIQLSEGSNRDPRHTELILRESKRIVRMVAGNIISETHHGFICANSSATSPRRRALRRATCSLMKA